MPRSRPARSARVVRVAQAGNGACRRSESTAMATSDGRGVRAGLALLGLLSLVDIVFTFVTPPEGEPGPPVAIVIAGGLLGLVSLALVVLMWRGARGVIGWVLVGLRVLSALLAVPAFFVPGVPTFFVVLAAAFVVLTVVGVVLVRPALRRAPAGHT